MFNPVAIMEDKASNLSLAHDFFYYSSSLSSLYQCRGSNGKRGPLYVSHFWEMTIHLS